MLNLLLRLSKFDVAAGKTFIDRFINYDETWCHNSLINYLIVRRMW